MVTNTGTYLDCPFHRFENGKDLSEVDLAYFTDLDGIVIPIPFQESLAITVAHLQNHEIRNRAVLLYTGWDAYCNTEQYYATHPYLTNEGPEYLNNTNFTL